MKLELLPNEIFVDCFEYLHGQDIFYAFDELNYRFNRLIRNISLHLNFENVKKTIFDRFCRAMLLDSEIKERILSLKLSNATDTCGEIRAFLTSFSFDEFSNLQSLTLTEVKKNDVEQIQSTLPSLCNLSYFRLKNPCDQHDKILSALPLWKIRTLSVRYLFHDLMLNYRTTSIINLTLEQCSLNDLRQILQYVPMLKYVKVDLMPTTRGNKFPDHYLYSINVQAVFLTHLIVKSSSDSFLCVKELLKQTPNLRTLTFTSGWRDMIDACGWERFLSVSLPDLNIFKFEFCFELDDKHGTEWTVDETLHKFQEFQTDFWYKQHHWYTEYYVNESDASIYTIPFIGTYYLLQSKKMRNYHPSMNNLQPFENVTDLRLHTAVFGENSEHYFSNVKSLMLASYWSSPIFDSISLNPQDIQTLKKFVNLSNLKHLDIILELSINLPFVLLEILKQAPHLSSIGIATSKLISLFGNDELCIYLNKMIKKLYIDSSVTTFIPSDQIATFCETLSNIEHLECSIERSDDLFFLLSHLSKLSCIKVASSYFPDDIKLWLQDKMTKLKKTFLLELNGKSSGYRRKLNIWIGET